MKLREFLNESLKQVEVDAVIETFRSYFPMYRTELGVDRIVEFENGSCFEFVAALKKVMESAGENPEIYFVTGTMIKKYRPWFDSEDSEIDLSQNIPVHAFLKLRKFYYDVNGRMGNVRDIKSRWSYYRNKNIVKVGQVELDKYIKKPEMVKTLIGIFRANMNKRWKD